MKKVLSLILAILLTFSMASFAFAEGEVSAITKDEAKSMALKYVDYNKIILERVTENDDTYIVTSNLQLKSSRYIEYVSTIDKYSGKVYKQTAEFKDLETLITRNITIDRAYELAVEALTLNEANISVLTKKAVTTENGKDAYNFVFSEGYFKTYECTVMKADGFIDNIKIEETTNIIQKLILIIKVFISKLSISNLLDNISATDILKVFQFFSK